LDKTPKEGLAVKGGEVRKEERSEIKAKFFSKKPF
jgi:hypothetical protein